MVLDYYNLGEQPFGVTPDPRYLYLSPTHREALASAVYGVSTGRGFTALIAMPGMGKTTLLFELLNKVRDHTKAVFLFQSRGSSQDLLRSLLEDLGIEDDGCDFWACSESLTNICRSSVPMGNGWFSFLMRRRTWMSPSLKQCECSRISKRLEKN